MNASVRTIELDGLTVVVSKNPAGANVAWKGVSDSRSPAAVLTPVIQQLNRELKGSAVTVDFSSLEYMNSATIGPLIQFVRSLASSAGPVLVLFDAEVDWQRTHLQCMRTIARTLTGVRVEGKTSAK